MRPAEPISLVAPPLRGKVVASQRWSKLAFLHWRVDSATVAPLLPDGVRPDLHDGSSWIGFIGFYLDRATLGGGPAIPFLGAFTEINVRLYGVDERGRRGVVFLSLEASRLAAVVAAQLAFSLPYRWSRTSIHDAGDSIEYRASRHRGGGSTTMLVRPRDVPVVGDATADFLTARWGLFTRRRKETMFLPNYHEPWALFRAELISLNDSLIEKAGLSGVAGRTPDSVLYSPGVTTQFGGPISSRAQRADV
jgi:uncharacterized protein YqjF (DUF2071 family)